MNRGQIVTIETLPRTRLPPVYRQSRRMLVTEKEPLSFTDGISQPEAEGSGIAGTNTKELPVKAGEFIFDYPDEAGESPPMHTLICRNGMASISSFARSIKMSTRSANGAPLAIAPERGGEYFFMPGLRGLRWLAPLDS